MPQIRFTPFAEIGGIYSTGLTGVGINSSGGLTNSSNVGLRVSFGISGHHRWAHTDIGLDYHGSMLHYFNNSFYDTMTHNLLLGIRHEFGPHTTLNISESAGTFSRDPGLLGMSQTAMYDPSRAEIPTTEYFDNRTMYLTTAANLVMRRSARLSISLGGMTNIVRRRSAALRSGTTEGANADVQYRISRRTTVGALYEYQHFTYSAFNGGADTHGVSGSFSTAVTAHMEFSGYLGVSRVESTAITVSQPDPVIAALLGLSQVTQIVHNVSVSPTFGARLARRVPRGVLYAGTHRSVNPGNGLFLTSMSTAFSGGYSYVGLRRWSASVEGGYDRNVALAGATGEYGSVSARAQISRRIGPWAHFVASYTLRHYDSADYGRYRRTLSDLSIGLGFAPGEIPLRVW